MKIYYVADMFPDAEKECRVNDSIVELNRDIEFIPAESNEVLLEDKLDREDWETVQDYFDVFLKYFSDTMWNFFDEEQHEEYGGLENYELFELEFAVRAVRLKRKIRR